MKKLIAAIALVLTAGLMHLSPALVSAQPNDVCKGAQLSGVSVDCQDNQLEPSDSQFGRLIRTIINVLSIIVGAVSVIMIIIGGFRYVISGGDSTGVTGAKNTIMYAVIGLVIVLFAQAIVRFVFSSTKPQPTEGQQSSRHLSIG